MNLVSCRWIVLSAICALLASCGSAATEDTTATARPANEVDSVIAAVFERWGNPADRSRESCDSSELIADVVAASLADYSILGAPMPETSRFARIVDSDDGRVRVIWWLAPCSGTWRQFRAVTAVKTGEGGCGVSVFPGRITDEAEGMEFSLGAVKRIYSLRDSLYLVHSVGQFSGAMPYEVLDAIVFTADSVGPSDVVFRFLDQVSTRIMLDKYHYFDSLAAHGHSMPLIIRVDSSDRTITFPTFRTTDGERVVDDVYGGSLTLDASDPIRLKWVDTGFVEVEW